MSPKSVYHETEDPCNDNNNKSSMQHKQQQVPMKKTGCWFSKGKNMKKIMNHNCIISAPSNTIKKQQEEVVEEYSSTSFSVSSELSNEINQTDQVRSKQHPSCKNTLKKDEEPVRKQLVRKQQQHGDNRKISCMKGSRSLEQKANNKSVSNKKLHVRFYMSMKSALLSIVSNNN